MLALRLPADIEKRLADLARKTGRTKSYYAREAIIEHIEDLEDIYLAEKEFRKAERGARTHKLAEILREYGMEG
jgi:RHH-type transcriptional regulator, rel operon repressor / antitoxin RelB